MPDRTTQIEIDKNSARWQMVVDGGASLEGQLPPRKYLVALEEIDVPGKARDVAEAHRNGVDP